MANKKGTSHDQIRASLARSIADRRPYLTGMAEDLALGMHPWPESKLSSEACTAILDELNPWSNLPVPDAREVIGDRLLRIAEVGRDCHLDPKQIKGYEAAARRLQEAVTKKSGVTPDLTAMFADPIGLRPVLEELVPLECRPPAEIASTPDEESYGIVGRVLETVCRTGSLDIGINFGQEQLGTSLASVIQATGLPLILQPIDDWFEHADSRTRRILLDRVFSRSRTLEAIGTECGLTRERIRQLEPTARDALLLKCGRLLQGVKAIFEPLTHHVMSGRRFNEATRLLGTSLICPDEVAAAIVWSAGPWTVDGEWLYHESLAPRIRQAIQFTRESADQYGLLRQHGLASFDGLFLSDADQARYLSESMGVVSMSGFWSLHDSLRSRVAAALLRIGRPATKLEIGEEAGLADEAHISNHLSALPGVVRADKDRWALEDWVDDVYDGIVAEINQRIDANHGSVPIAFLLFELPRRFGVSENSVSTYLQTAAFVVEDGLVRRAEVGYFNASPPGKWPDACWVDGMWGQKIRLEQRHFVGYSLRVRFDIAYANGIRPDCNLKVPLDGDGSLVSVIWRAHDPARLIDVGRVSDWLLARGYRAGELVLVSPGLDVVRIERWDDVIETPGAELFTEERTELDDPLFDLLEGK
jgi:hypothetical protein